MMVGTVILFSCFNFESQHQVFFRTEGIFAHEWFSLQWTLKIFGYVINGFSFAAFSSLIAFNWNVRRLTTIVLSLLMISNFIQLYFIYLFDHGSAGRDIPVYTAIFYLAMNAGLAALLYALIFGKKTNAYFAKMKTKTDRIKIRHKI
jgi:hypothetical protein